MPALLVVHHTPSPAMAEMFDAAVSGARTDEVPGVEVIIRPALTAGAADVLSADGYLLGTPANIGYMSGALKHFFDQIYYPCLDATARFKSEGRTAGERKAIDLLDEGGADAKLEGRNMTMVIAPK